MRIGALAKKHAFESLVSALLMALIAIYCHALYEQKDMEIRLRGNEVDCQRNAALILQQQSALEQRTQMLQRELEQRTEAAQNEMKSVYNQFQSRVQSLEHLVTTLAGVLKRNGINPKEGGQ